MNSKKILFNSLENLLKKKAFNKITVQDILDDAEVSRGTFYKYFKDKYDLTSQYYESNIEENIFNTYDGDNWIELLHKTMQYMKDHYEYFKNVFAATGQDSFFAYFWWKSLNVYERIYKANKNIDELSEEDIFKLHFVNYGAVFCLIQWIQDDCKTPIETMLEGYASMVPQEFYSYQK